MAAIAGEQPADSAQTPLRERIEAVEGFADNAAKLLVVGEMEWAAVEADYRLLAINSSLRRQLESIRASTLARARPGEICRRGVAVEVLMLVGRHRRRGIDQEPGSS